MVRETGLRPMGQVAMTAVLLMIGMPILLLRVVVQIVTTWPNKRNQRPRGCRLTRSYPSSTRYCNG